MCQKTEKYTLTVVHGTEPI